MKSRIVYAALASTLLVGCPMTTEPNALNVVETRYCLGRGADYNRFLFVDVSDYPGRCAVVYLSLPGEALVETSVTVVDLPCIDVWFDAFDFGPVADDVQGTAICQYSVETIPDGRRVTYDVSLTLTGPSGERSTNITGEAIEHAAGICRGRLPDGP